MRMSHRKTAMVIAVLTSLVLGAGVAVGAPPSSQRAQGSGWDGDGLHDAWRLIRSEKFNRPMRAGNDTGWFPNKDEKGTGWPDVLSTFSFSRSSGSIRACASACTITRWRRPLFGKSFT